METDVLEHGKILNKGKERVACSGRCCSTMTSGGSLLSLLLSVLLLLNLNKIEPTEIAFLDPRLS